ncbi:hypothetical protein GQ42DRAFT_109692, partial [Ramicandelaber brevisporus]
GGLNSDDMGLGKTLTAIALMVSEPFGPPLPMMELEATLVVCPLSVVENWETQLKTHLKSTHQLSVHVYHEKGRKIDVQQLSQFDVVLTTYQVIANEYKASDFEPEKKKNGSEDVSRLPSFELSSLFTIHWHRVILDEAHTIRESKTLTARAACALSAGRRWALTGTPIVNRIDDLGTLVKFIGVPQLSDTRQWQSIIGKPFTSNMKLVQQSAMNRLRKLMQTLCMRRTKMGKDRNGQLLLKLPEKIERVQWLDLEVRERALYSAVELKAREKLVELLNEGNLMDNYMYILVFILRLRQVCTHVDLYNPGASVQLRLGQEEEEGDNNDQDNQSAQAANSLRNKLLKGEPDSTARNAAINANVEAVLEEQRRRSRRERKARRSARSTRPGGGRSISTVISLLNGRIAESKRVTRPDGTPRDKCVIFSQWTKMLDLIEVHLQSRGIAWRRLDGSMNRDERTEALQIFQDRQSAVDIMLISLRAGGVGLNLTSARRVYMMEPYWNPAVEDQAVDRVHRLGQTSDVEIVRFLIRDSIEERMVMLQFAKAKL